MTGPARPLVLLDVDGPLSPWAANQRTRPPGFVEHRMRLAGWSRRRPLRIWLNPAHGAALLRVAGQIGADLAWATNWDQDANTMIGPVVGLPVLPVDVHPVARDEFLAGRATSGLATELVRVDPRVGLTDDDLAVITSWGRSLGDVR